MQMLIWLYFIRLEELFRTSTVEYPTFLRIFAGAFNVSVRAQPRA